MTTRRFRQLRQTALSIEPAQPGAAMSLVRRDAETGVGHAKRTEDPSMQHCTQWCALESCDQKSEQVGRQTIMKRGARMVDQRQCRQACHPRVRGERVIDLRAERLRVGASDRTAMKVAIGQTG